MGATMSTQPQPSPSSVPYLTINYLSRAILVRLPPSRSAAVLKAREVLSLPPELDNHAVRLVLQLDGNMVEITEEAWELVPPGGSLRVVIEKDEQQQHAGTKKRSLVEDETEGTKTAMKKVKFVEDQLQVSKAEETLEIAPPTTPLPLPSIPFAPIASSAPDLLLNTVAEPSHTTTTFYLPTKTPTPAGCGSSRCIHKRATASALKGAAPATTMMEELSHEETMRLIMEMESNNSDPMRDVEEFWEEDSILVKEHSQDRFWTIEVDDHTDTLNTLFRRAGKHLDAKYGDFIIYAEGGELELDHGYKYLWKFGLRAGCKINICWPIEGQMIVEVFVKQGERHILEVYTTDTILTVKKRLVGLVRLPCERQVLGYDLNKAELNDDYVLMNGIDPYYNTGSLPLSFTDREGWAPVVEPSKPTVAATEPAEPEVEGKGKGVAKGERVEEEVREVAAATTFGGPADVVVKVEGDEGVGDESELLATTAEEGTMVVEEVVQS